MPEGPHAWPSPAGYQAPLVTVIGPTGHRRLGAVSVSLDAGFAASPEATPDLTWAPNGEEGQWPHGPLLPQPGSGPPHSLALTWPGEGRTQA